MDYKNKDFLKKCSQELSERRNIVAESSNQNNSD